MYLLRLSVDMHTCVCKQCKRVSTLLGVLFMRGSKQQDVVWDSITNTRTAYFLFQFRNLKGFGSLLQAWFMRTAKKKMKCREQLHTRRSSQNFGPENFCNGLPDYLNASEALTLCKLACNRLHFLMYCSPLINSFFLLCSLLSSTLFLSFILYSSQFPLKP